MTMLEDQNGRTVKVITGVNVIFPTIQTPGYAIKYVMY
jgi:predicted house-cleaning NTP pyrophosphatase (Maf/HAM1 superfamily)